MNILNKVEVKAGILNTIAKSIYSDFRIKTREAVSNSLDNKASSFILSVDSNNSIISFFDDGTGISQAFFQEIFTSIGYGTTRHADTTNSYFGLGLMSVLQIGKEAAIISKCAGEAKTNYYRIETCKIFEDSNEIKPVNDSKEFIQYGDLEIARSELSPLSDETIVLLNNGEFPDHYTEILLLNVEPEVIEIFTSEEFVTSLRKILPLKPADNDQFFNRIKSTTKLNEISAILHNDDYCKTIDVYYCRLGYGEDYKQVSKYYPNFMEDIIFTDDDIQIYNSRENSFVAYWLISSQDINRGDAPKESGFWVRNRNYLVKSSDFFKKPGTRKTIVTDPLVNWFYGEVFHKDMTDMLVVTRDEYLWDSVRFQAFHTELEGAIHNVNQQYRDIWKRGKRVVEALVEPFINIKSEKVLDRFDSVLLSSGIIASLDDIESSREKVCSAFMNRSIENEQNIIGTKLINNKTDLVLAENVEGIIKVVVSGSPLKKDYIRERDPDTQGILLKISPDIFSTFQANFLGKTFKVNYVWDSTNKADLSINKDTENIYINLASNDIARFRLSFIEYIIVVKIAHLYSNNKDEMLRLILDMLGNKHVKNSGNNIEPGDVFSSLEDVLKRR